MSCCREGEDKGAAEAIEIHQKALDDLVSVNSLFTVAVFVGLSYANPADLTSLENRPECNADSGTAKRLVVYEVISFSLFLMSSLVAKTVKVHLIIYRKLPHYFNQKKWRYYRCAMFLLSAWGSILGCVFLTLSMVDVIQIKIGTLSCGSAYTARAVASLIAIVALALCIYAPAMMHAIYKSIRFDSASKGQTTYIAAKKRKEYV